MRNQMNVEPMKEQYDFARGKRGAALPDARKTRITIYLDDNVLQRLNTASVRTGKVYETLINEALCQYRADNDRSISDTKEG